MSTNYPKNGLPDEAQAWRRKIEESLDDVIRTTGITRTNGIAAEQGQISLRRSLANANLSLEDQDAAIKDARRVPAAPEDVQVTTDAYFDEYGVPRADANASCSTVLADVQGRPIIIARHELHGRKTTSSDSFAHLAETVSDFVEITARGLPAGEEWAFKMRAVSEAGVAGEFSAEVVVMLAKDETAPPKPSTPQTTARLGQVMVNWDGLSAEGGIQPPDFSHCEVYMAQSLNGAGYKVGTIDKDGDTFYAPEQDYNVTRWFYLYAVDYAGNRSVPSDRASAVVVPLVDTDLIGRIIDGANVKLETLNSELIANGAILEEKLADNAVSLAKLDSLTRDAIHNAGEDATTANGRVTTSLSAPTAANGVGKPEGALWFRYNAGGTLLGTWRWSGTAWVTQAWGADAIASEAVTREKIAQNAIDVTKIANGAIEAGKLAAGAVDATKLADAVNGKIEQGISDAASAANLANTALTTADGKNTVTYSTDLPSGSGRVGDTWFRRNSSGQIISVWSWTGSEWAERPITNEVIANLDAAKITSGYINAQRIDANSITANKLTISDFTNLADGSDFEADARVPWALQAGRFEVTTAQAYSGTRSLAVIGGGGGASNLNIPLPVRGGDKFYVEFWGRKSADWDGQATNSAIRFGFNNGGGAARLGYAASQFTAANVWEKRSTTFTTPEGSTQIDVSLRNSDATAGTVWLDDIIIRRMSGGELIVDGAITADKIEANAVTAVKIAANAITSDKITANAITAAKIEAGAVTAGKIAANAVTATEILAGTITAASGILANASVGTAEIADASITNAKIASLDAGKITSGYIDAARIDAGSITAKKIAIGDFTNFAMDIQSATERAAFPATGQFRYTVAAGSSPGGAQAPNLVVMDPGTGYAANRVGNDFSVTSGDKIFMSYMARRRGADSRVALNLRVFDAEGVQIAADLRPSIAPVDAPDQTWVTYEGIVTIPTGGFVASPAWKRNSSGQTTGDWLLYKPIIRRAATGELLVDGAVTARTIGAEAITAEKIAAGAIIAGKISANAVGTDELMANSVISDKIVSNAITSAKIAALQIEAGHLKANAVTADKIEAGSITTVKLAAGAITADKISARSISTDKLTIGNTSNLVDDANFDAPLGQAWLAGSSGWNITAISGRSAVRYTPDADSSVLRNRSSGGNGFPVVPGEKYQMFASVYNSNLSVGVPAVCVYWYAPDGSYLSSSNASTGSSTGTTEVATEVTVPSGAATGVFTLRVTGTSASATGSVVFSYPRLVRKADAELIVDGAITAAKITADAIDGKTITGATVRSAASGARTELNSSGLRVVNSSNQDLVRIGYGIGTGMSVRNPNTGVLVPLADAAFGSLAVSRSNTLTVAPTGSPETVQTVFTRHTADTCTITFVATAATYLVSFGQTWSVDYLDVPDNIEPFVGIRVNGAGVNAGGVRLTARLGGQLQRWSTIPIHRAAQVYGATSIDTTVGNTYTLEMDFSMRVLSTSSGSVPANLSDRFITAMPIFS